MTRLDTWNQLQANGLKAYREIPEASCALAYRKDTKQFKRFIGKQQGWVLDIGCGIEVAGYLDKRNLGHTLGIDPLETEADFGLMARLRMCAEKLWESWGSYFSLVILAGTLDHVLDPAQVLSEARRVVKPSGRIVVQIGIPNNVTRGPLATVCLNVFHRFVPVRETVDCEKIQDFVQTLSVPDGCPDPFHFKYYTEAEIESLFAAAQLRVSRVRRIPGSTFYELRK